MSNETGNRKSYEEKLVAGLEQHLPYLQKNRWAREAARLRAVAGQQGDQEDMAARQNLLAHYQSRGDIEGSRLPLLDAIRRGAAILTNSKSDESDSDYAPMDSDAKEGLARDLVDIEQEVSPQVASPIAIIIAGQPGSGKTVLAAQARQEFLRAGARAIEIDRDEIRAGLAGMGGRAGQSLEFADATYLDADDIAARMARLAVHSRRNLIISDPVLNQDQTVRLAGDLKGAGYRVELRATAVSPDLSLAECYVRREVEIAVLAGEKA